MDCSRLALVNAHAAATGLIAEAEALAAALIDLKEEVAAAKAKLKAQHSEASSRAAVAASVMQGVEAQLVALQVEQEASARQLALAKEQAFAAKADANAILAARDKASEAAQERIQDLELRLKTVEKEKSSKEAQEKATTSASAASLALELEAVRSTLRLVNQALAEKEVALQSMKSAPEVDSRISEEAENLRRALAAQAAELALARAQAASPRIQAADERDSVRVTQLLAQLGFRTSELAAIAKIKTEQESRLVQLAALLRDSNDRCASLMQTQECEGEAGKRKRLSTEA